MTFNTQRCRRLFFIILVVIAVDALGGQQSNPVVAQVQDRRHVNLDGQLNFRDIGGYKTADGRMVKWTRVYRSGELPRLSDKDVAHLEKLGIATVVNFLSEDEIKARGGDRLPSGVTEVFLPISGEAENDLAKVVLEARQTADFSQVPVELNSEVHRILTGDAAKKQYASLLGLAAAEDQRPQPRPAWIMGWDELNPAQRSSRARDMEIYTAMIDYMDASSGRLFDYLRHIGKGAVCQDKRGDTAQHDDSLCQAGRWEKILSLLNGRFVAGIQLNARPGKNGRPGIAANNNLMQARC